MKQTIPDTVMATILDRISHIELLIAGLNNDKELINNRIDELTEEYIELSEYIGTPGTANKNVKEPSIVAECKPKTIDEIQKEAKECGMSYGKYLQSIKEKMPYRNEVKETGKWKP